MSLLTRTDVTAVKFYNDYILAGIGSRINVFKRSSSKLLQRLDGLSGQKIYGFVSCESCKKILVFGGKQFTIISLESCSKSCVESLPGGPFKRLLDPVVCSDWIHSGVWIDEGSVALLTAHNVVQKWNTATGTLVSNHPSRDNSILYSGLLVKVQNDILVFAGTVFSEVIIHTCGDETPLHHLKGHKGVIFSISCKPGHNIIVTTSDDRSVRIWGPNNSPAYPSGTLKYWETINLVCKHEIYGHSARVMRSCITDSLVISVGEDSAICYWHYHGKLVRRILGHQNSPIWSVDCDSDSLVTGGGDCGVTVYPLTITNDYCQSEIINIDVNTPKHVVFTARNNIVILDANNLIHYNIKSTTTTVHQLNHETTYKLISVSSCKQLIAVADMSGKLDIFVENCKDEACIVKVIDTKLNVGKILSMQWAGNRHIVFCFENGAISIMASNNSNAEVYAKFTLPPCKERWLTASAVDSTNTIFIVGDRCGNIHVYIKGQKDPVKSLSKVHGRYGPTSINIRNNEIVTTGRDGSIKYFSINKNIIKHMYARELEFQWVEKFLDNDEKLICGFQERVFVVYDAKNNCKLLEVMCGGGHRSWDAVRYFDKQSNGYEEFIKLVYLKNADINVTKLKLSNVAPKNIINGSHSKEINCLKSYKTELTTFYITGGEDTTLRVSGVDKGMVFKDEFIFKQLSTIRTVKIHHLDDKKITIVSAGGRAQICIKNQHFIEDNHKIIVKAEELIDYQVKGTDKDRKGNETWRNQAIKFDPETRIMDIDMIKNADNLIIFTGCSDAYIRVFTYKNDDKKLDIINETKYHSSCILKTNCIKILDKDMLVTCDTRGNVAFWDVSHVTCTKLSSIFNVKTNKSGINSFVSTPLPNNRLLVGTGGDDNAIHLVLLAILDHDNLTSMKVLNTWIADKYHSSQITGLCLVDEFMISASLDQRITLFHWDITEDVIRCEFLSQSHTDVADVQGMDLIDHNNDAITICVFGKGMEVISVHKSH